MPKKKRSEGDDKVVPHHVTENYEWKCNKCRAKGKAYTKKDAAAAKLLHEAFVHGK